MHVHSTGSFCSRPIRTPSWTLADWSEATFLSIFFWETQTLPVFIFVSLVVPGPAQYCGRRMQDSRVVVGLDVAHGWTPVRTTLGMPYFHVCPCIRENLVGGSKMGRY
jgi:hypothetical protein